MTTRPLTKTLIFALACLEDTHQGKRGVWGPKSGWVLTTPASTNRKMQSLEARGLVSSTSNPGDFPTYMLTPEGEAAITKLKATGWK